MFIFAPGKDESLHPTPTSARRQSALIDALTFLFKVDLDIRTFLFTDAQGKTEYSLRSDEAEQRALASVRDFWRTLVVGISRHQNPSFDFRAKLLEIDSASRLLFQTT
jgi:hypothetical protein